MRRRESREALFHDGQRINRELVRRGASTLRPNRSVMRQIALDQKCSQTHLWRAWDAYAWNNYPEGLGS